MQEAKGSRKPNKSNQKPQTKYSTGEGAPFFRQTRSADKCFRDRLSADLGLLCAAAAAGKQVLARLALTGAQRCRQAVFKGAAATVFRLGFNLWEGFLAHA